MTDKPKVLVVDDEANNRRLLESILAAEGHAVRCAASGEEALSSAAEQPPDLILLDILLPDIDGIEVARRFKAEAATRAIPIIMITMLEDRESRMRALQAGAEDFLSKPVDPAELLVRVRNLLRLKEYGDFLASHNRLLAEQVRERTAALAESEAKFRAIFEGALDGILLADAETWQFFIGNPMIAYELGYSPEEIAQIGVRDIHPEQDLPHVIEQFEKQLRGEVDLATNIPVRRKDGSVFYADIKSSPVQIGGRIYLMGIFRDITERLERERQVSRLNVALRLLSACNVALVHAQTEEELFRSVCRQIVETGGYRLAWVEYPHGEGEAPRVVAWFGDEAAFRRHAELAGSPEHADLCLTTLSQRTRQTEVCNDLRDMPARCFGPLREVGVEAILALPLLHNDDIHGVLTVFSPTPDAFGADETGLAEELARDLAYGIATLRTRAERDEGAVSLRQALEETIAAIALTLEKRDPYTAGHQQRVAGLASAIAAEMGLPPRQIEGIHFGALIHDIGKVYVPAEILNRPGRLSDLEFGLIKTHPQVGFDIVRDIPFPWPVAQMVHQHHERLDGTGYPQGLKGAEITLEARILAVADVVEAMSSHRPYRAALGIDAGLAEIERLRGAHFDAAADACLRLFRERGYRLET